MTTNQHYDAGHDFAPLTAYLARNPEKAHLPWQYMGHDGGGTFYREREDGNHLKVTATGRLACVHVIVKTDRVSITESDTLRHL
ncbi:hypothetical protein UFOVP929_46 [uncultured Caudovirales phage]|uniref:Uncharacterized protein n=1 Tax=uncultured Caudovirales phage TaxID=2100421 RepID=A0A6J5PM60_9CAUD|nr:hypothetical protein UFOVP929_46 [uncultured Caudovirales phage]